MTCDRHTTENCRPLWRSDLCGPQFDRYTGGVSLSAYQCFIAHGWWCPDCGSETPCPDGLPSIGGPPAHERWWVRLTKKHAVEVHAQGVLGRELPKLACAIEAAHRVVDARATAQAKREAGQVGWFASESAPLTIWHWPHINMQVGAVVSGIRPRTPQNCRICGATIGAGSSCWRPYSAVSRMSMLAAADRYCARCVSEMPRAQLDGVRPTPALRLPDLRLLR